VAARTAKPARGVSRPSTENATVATALLSDLVERGVDPEQGILCVIDGAKALRKAICTVFRGPPPVQRCVRHKNRKMHRLMRGVRPAGRGAPTASRNQHES
jgi:transposase-like protein